MTVRREIAQSRARPARGGQRTGSVVFGNASPVAPQTGTGAKKKGASPQQYVEGASGGQARRSSESAIAAEVLMNNLG
jgi:hypothetical protein